MPSRRPVAEALARANNELEPLPDFSSPSHAALCALLTIPGSDCDCGIADARPTAAIERGKSLLEADLAARRANGVDTCGATSPWLTHCTSAVEHQGSHSWQDQDRFPVVPSDVGGGSLVPLEDAEKVFGSFTASYTPSELPDMPKPKGRAPMTQAASVIHLTATLKRLGIKSGTQADPDPYVELVVRTNDLGACAELGWQVGKSLDLTVAPEQLRLGGEVEPKP